ncbi:MAG: ankyrin repeat domain-containing protein [Akkermansiaceae bacterium]|nr:ankyrin repeat domain-containing protein [Armatimonadota bacterium]
MFVSSTRFTKSISTSVALLLLATACAPTVAHAITPLPVGTYAIAAASSDTLLKAVAEGSGEKMNIALAAGEDINQTDKNGKTALMLAASLGRTDLVKALLEKGAAVNQQDIEGRTALHCVLAGAEPEKPKKKRGFGAFMDQAKKAGGKALSMVASAGPLAMFLPGGALLQNLAQGMMGGGINSLLAPGASFGLGNQSAWSGVLGAALMNGSKEKNGAGLVLGALDGVLQTGTPSANVASSWSTLLSSATSGKDQTQMLKAMTNLGDDATPEERATWNAFLEAARSGDEETVQTMVADPAVAPILAKATDGLRAAATQIPGRDGGAAITEALLAHGADTTLTDKKGQTALARAQDAKLDAVVGLLEKKASPVATPSVIP